MDNKAQNRYNDEVSIKEILQVLVQQKTFILLFCISATLSALALTYITSEKYESAITISYRPQEVIRFKAYESEAFGAPLPIPPFNLISKNLDELVHSEPLLRLVVLELNLHEEISGPVGGPWYTKLYQETKKYLMNLRSDIWMYMKYGRLIEEDPVFSATKKLRKNVMFVDKSAYIFYIVVRDKYPKRAPMIVDSIATHLIDYLHKEQKTPGTAKAEHLGGLLLQKSHNIEKLELELEELMTQNLIVSSTLEAEQSMSRWSALELERIQVESEIKKSEALIAKAEKIFANRKAAPKSKPQFIQYEDYVRLSSDKLFGTIELDGLLAKLRLIESEIKTLQAKLKNLPTIQTQIEQLKTRIEISKRGFVQISDAYQEALILSTTSLSEAEILHRATTPTIPVAPIKIYNAGLAALLSLFISIGLVYLLTYADINFLFTTVKQSENKEIPDNNNE